ncbi:MAG: cation transporter [Pseudonocardiales bacterium]|nr:cation transporter [Actinomycetota bacterium]
MPDRTYVVTGMTCEHCTSAVSGEVGKIAGVQGVRVDLATGHITVTGDGYSDDEIEAAVDEAGYALSEA